MSTLAVPRHFGPPRERGGLGALLLAVLSHSLLFAFLYFGISWQTTNVSVVEAELWTPDVQIAAPAPPAPPPAKVESPRREPPPKATPAKAAPAPVKPDIALKTAPPKKVPPREDPRPEPKVEPKAVPQPQPPEPPKAQPRAINPPLQASLPTPPQPIITAPPVAAPTNSTPSDLANIMAQATRPSTGTATQTSGPRNDPSYAAAIRSKILSNLRFPVPSNLVGNPEAVFIIEQLPSGEIVRLNRRRASGLPAFDAAVERAIEASSPLPKGRDGRVERSLELVFTPLDKN